MPDSDSAQSRHREWYGNCPKCQPEHRALYFKSGPNKAGKYTFVCYHCGANTTREALPVQFESEYVDRLIRCGNALCEFVDEDDPFAHEWVAGWQLLTSLREDRK